MRRVSAASSNPIVALTSLAALAATLAITIVVLPASASAQLIQVKTVPVASGDQFLLFPSDNLGMGGVGLALVDTLGDPFGNPATGSRLSESFFFSSPTYYGISGRNGSGRSLPLGALFVSGDWFGGGALSLQELKGAERNPGWPVFLDMPAWSSRAWPWPDPGQDLSEASARNVYAFGMAGLRIPHLDLSVGISGSYADLGAVDGVDLLYAQSQEIDQSGHVSDLRLGVMKEWEGDRSLELLVIRNRVRMRHDVTYLNLVWEPIPPDTFPVPQWRNRIEENLDHTDTWGAHLAYRRPLNPNGWKLGWSLTANRKDHPKIPNYEIQNIPRDPGETWAYALGLGIAKTEGPARFAVDLFLEPIRSETWADAATDTTSVLGNVIRAGEKTIENDFLFTNLQIKTGASWDYRKATFLAGLQLRSISYDLDQFDRIQVSKRTQDESWMEWTPSIGLSLKLPGIDVQWVSRVTTGTGRPGTRWTNARMDEAAGAVPLSSDFILAPSGPLTLQDARVTTHQLSVVIPIR
ncbi:MAG: hypothetical protein MUO50_16855 [Longimicrobiales bacterium]|nr:hypothetical protein [Longimicrobiales bacterium]